MKATGVVRRIDDLGRIVIPKEIRRNLKINEGDNLEIFVENTGVILKKYSVLDDLIDFSSKLVDSFYKVYNKGIIITDSDKVIATSKNYSSYLSNELNSLIKGNILDRKEITGNNLIVSDLYSNFFLAPIIVNSDALGSIILVDNNILNSDKANIRLLNAILVKNIEE